MPIPSCEYPKCLRDGVCPLTNRKSESDFEVCQTSVPWRIQWMKEVRIATSSPVILPSLIKAGKPKVKPCRGCRGRKEKLNSALPTIGPRLSSWINSIGSLFGLTSDHPVDGKWAVVVTTSPLTKKKDNYFLGYRGTLEYCLRSLREAGFPKEIVTIYAEPNSQTPSDYEVVRRSERKGLYHNLRHGIDDTIRRHNPDVILTVEDDMIFQPGLYSWLKKNPWPGSAALVSLFRMRMFEFKGQPVDSEMLLEPPTEPNWRKVIPSYQKRPWGSGAIVLTRPTAEHWLEHPGRFRGTPDLVFGSWATAVEAEYWMASPSRAQHLVPQDGCTWPRSTWQSGANHNFTAKDLPFELPSYVTEKIEAEKKNPTPPFVVPKRERTKVFLISFNRLDWLRSMCEAIENYDGAEIVIVDNASTWEPLLSWLDGCKYEVVRSENNLGKKVVWTLGLDRDVSEPYVVSDPDLDLSKVPYDVLDVLREGLCYLDFHSCGLSLEIDDLPKNSLTDRVKKQEKGFWTKKLVRGYYEARIDTTFAMYRVGAVPTYGTKIALRTDRPYTARHIPWYLTEENLTEEDRYYYSVGCTWGGGSYANQIKRDVIKIGA